MDVSEVARADEEIISIGQIVHAQKSSVSEMAGEKSRKARREVDLERVAEALFNECDSRSVRRPDGPLAEAGKLRDLWRQMVLGRAARPRLRAHAGCPRSGEDERHHQCAARLHHVCPTSRTARPAARRFARRISEYFRESNTPCAPPANAAFTA